MITMMKMDEVCVCVCACVRACVTILFLVIVLAQTVHTISSFVESATSWWNWPWSKSFVSVVPDRITSPAAAAAAPVGTSGRPPISTAVTDQGLPAARKQLSQVFSGSEWQWRHAATESGLHARAVFGQWAGGGSSAAIGDSQLSGATDCLRDTAGAIQHDGPTVWTIKSVVSTVEQERWWKTRPGTWRVRSWCSCRVRWRGSAGEKCRSGAFSFVAVSGSFVICFRSSSGCQHGCVLWFGGHHGCDVGIRCELSWCVPVESSECCWYYSTPVVSNSVTSVAFLWCKDTILPHFPIPAGQFCLPSMTSY